jgi:CubicO group peptidase (beta-lactamase class C family)
MPRDDAAPEKSVTEKLDELFAPWNRSDAPGLVVGAARDGATIYRRGFGMASLETAVANTPRTLMRIGSTSKHFTCLLALLLAEDGKLTIDAPIRAYVSELTGPAGDPTLRQLMQHRGGSRCYLDLAFIGHGAGMSPTGSALASLARQSGRNFAPGEAMIYNNGGYHLVSIAIERVGGALFEDQLHERLFAPVGMVDTASIPSDHVITPGIATMHLPRPGGGWRRGLFPSEEVRGEGAIVSTVDDMLRWMAHLRRRDRFGSAATWEALTERPVYADGSVGSNALGLMLDDYRGLKTVHHAGGVFGGTCQMLTLPDHGLDIIILVNGAPAADPVRLAEQVVDVVLAGAVGEGAQTIDAKDHPALTGDWWSEKTGMIYTLVDDKGVLKAQCARTPPGIALRPAGEGRMVLPAGGLGEIAFGVDPGDPGEITISFGGRSAAYRKVSKEDADPAAFARSVAGDYFSADGDCTATIAQEGERLVLRARDGFGQAEATITPLGETIAFAEPAPPWTLLWTTLQFEPGETGVAGFSLNTARTRGLGFRRLQA